MLRTSSYTIYVDLPNNREEMLLVHGYTGAYDRVSRRVVDYLRSLEPKRPPKPLYGEWSEHRDELREVSPPSPEVVETLKKRGYLTGLAPEEERTFFTRLALQLHKRASERPPSYLLMPTYDCNLRCSYCFQDHMRTDLRFRALLKTMETGMVDLIFEVMPQIEARHGVGESSPPHRSIGFFGGEPLLARHRPILEYIMRKARARDEASFWAVTNGTELTAYRDLLGPAQISRLQITLDGPQKEHDLRRIYPDGAGSFAKIARNITMALDSGTEISIRLNIDQNNIVHLPGVADEFFDRGWDKYENFSAYTAPINAVNDKTSKEATFNSWELDQALTQMRKDHPNLWIVDRPDESIRLRARRLFEGHQELVPQMRPSFCGAHDQMYIFDPFGDIYACWEKTGDAKIRIAHIKEGGTIEFMHDEHRMWRSRSVASNPVCSRCRYALHCGGGCAILALGQRGKFHSNYCDGYASRFRASIAEAYGAYLAGEASRGGHERLCDL